LLEYPRTAAAARVLLREALPLLDELAGRLPAHQSWAWAQAMHAMAYRATRGSRRSLRRWLRRFLAPDPGRGPEAYELAAAPLYDPLTPCLSHLFPRLLPALACPARRLAVVEIAKAAHEHGPLPAHPLREHLGVLAEMLALPPRQPNRA
jgi:hypothetical protein